MSLTLIVKQPFTILLHPFTNMICNPCNLIGPQQIRKRYFCTLYGLKSLLRSLRNSRGRLEASLLLDTKPPIKDFILLGNKIHFHSAAIVRVCILEKPGFALTLACPRLQKRQWCSAAVQRNVMLTQAMDGEREREVEPLSLIFSATAPLSQINRALFSFGLFYFHDLPTI